MSRIMTNSSGHHEQPKASNRRVPEIPTCLQRAIHPVQQVSGCSAHDRKAMHVLGDGKKVIYGIQEHV